MRVSSEGERQSTDLQRDALLQVGVDLRHIFEDRASGAKDNRKGLQECLHYLKSGDCLVVWKLDRLGRSLTHLIKIINELKGRGVAFKSITEQMDTTTPHGEMLFGLFGVLAQYERALITERVKAGLEAALKRGRKGGRRPVITQEKIEAIKKALNTGTSKASICRMFGIKRSTLYDTLNRVVKDSSTIHEAIT